MRVVVCPKPNRWGGYVLALAAMAWVCLFAGDVMAQAAHPFGVPERTVGPAGPDFMRSFFAYVSYWQSHFYRQLTGAVRVWQEEGGIGWLLIGLSFAYGVFHALGPGHGKAVIASYVVANRQTARNGAVLALVASLVQALVAIVLVTVLALILNVTANVMNDATRWLEIIAYGMVVLLGCVLVWRKAIRPLLPEWPSRHGARLDRDATRQTGGDNYLAHQAHAAHDSEQHQHHFGHDHHHHDACGCGHSHAPDPGAVSGQLDLKRAWAALLAVGLRPCSGALIVLVFAIAQDFYWAGVASALAMGLGTGLTVATLAVLSVWAGNAAERLGGAMSSRWASRLRYAIEALAATLVLLMGVILLGAAITT